MILRAKFHVMLSLFSFFKNIDFYGNIVFAPSTPLKMISTLKRKYGQSYKWCFCRNYAFKRMTRLHSQKDRRWHFGENFTLGGNPTDVKTRL